MERSDRAGGRPISPSESGSSARGTAKADSERERLVVLGRLAASVAHEINGCLAVLELELGEAQAIVDATSETGRPDSRSRLRERIAGASECASRIAELVTEVRHFGRPDAAAPEPVDLDDVAGAALRLTAPLVSQVARTEVALERPKSVLGHRSALVQVAVNLLRNAADALRACDRPREASCVVLSTRTEGATAVLRVEDNGPGIAPELLARLPARYLSTKPAGEGTGLGLTICQEIVTAHGGELRLESTLGQGTRVEVRFPTV